MAMIMLGSLFQIVPVALGGQLPASPKLGQVVYVGLTGGTLLLAVGLLVPHLPFVIQLGLIMLAVAFITFLVITFAGVQSVKDAGPSRNGVRIALVALFITVVVGLLLGLRVSGIQVGTLDRRWTDLHALWGIAGWVALLVAAVAFRVVPMFQKTPPYPAWLENRLIRTLLLALCLWTIGQVGVTLQNETYWGSILSIGKLLVGASLLVFAITTLYLQLKRDKREWNITVWYWRFGLLSLITGIGVTYWAWWNSPDVSGSWLAGGAVLIFLGFPISVINGMLYKIIPFLVWLHLTMTAQATGKSRREVPGVKNIIAAKLTIIQFVFHCIAILLLTLLVLSPMNWLLWAAGLSLAASFVILEWNVVSAIRLYLQTTKTFKTSA